MRLFVTGGTGFIGSHFVQLAQARGHEVVALRRARAAPRIELGPEPNWVEGSLENLPSGCFEGCEALFHFAAYGVSPQKCEWTAAFETNVAASVRLVEKALAAGVARVVACGTCLEFGMSAERYEFVPANAPLEPVGPYAASKAAFSIALGALARSSTQSFHLLRPFHVYGEGQHPENFWPSLKEAAIAGADFSMSPGGQVRDFTPVEAAAAQFLAALNHPAQPGEVHLSNVGSGTSMTLLDFAKSQWQKFRAKGRLLPGALPYRREEVMRLTPEMEEHAR